MLHYFRQHRQSYGLLLVPLLLLVWLMFSCQDCFAGSDNAASQKLHAAMDCCPSAAHADHDNTAEQGCDNNYLLTQPMLSDEHNMHLADFADVIMADNEARFAAVYAQLIQPGGLDSDPHSFSDRLFTSYRILLI